MSYLPSLKSMVKRVKGKCPVDTLGVLKAKFPTETTSQQFFQDWGAQSQVRFGPHERGYGKGLVSPRSIASSLRQAASLPSPRNHSGTGER
ncbi:hypothetical protein TREES_T100002954 [Tupaia chinensis]|uniref:Uncharacterized protein n=1 Tax=Tupaia chinensis TaxID=246437 RepID=L9KQK0_TUPCH|nr:hypothetical protein TREES_T100002954 [Tupaia chinensis]